MALFWHHCLTIYVSLIVILDGSGVLLLNINQQQHDHDFKCHQCLNYININLGTLTMNLSKSISMSSIEDEMSSCECPSYTLRNSSHSILEYTVYQQSRISAVGTIKSSNDFIEFSINYWIDNILLEESNIYYKPNTGYFMHSTSYRG